MDGTKPKDSIAQNDMLSESSVTHLSGLTNPPESLQKIYREGDKIYQVDDENITMLKDGPIPNTSTMEIEPPNSDEMASGESLFKTFVFDKKISKEETEKCLTFWRSVVEKNLEPIKCTLIENISKNHEEAEAEKKAASSKKKGRGKCKPKITEPKEPSIASSKRIVWSEILRELQKRKLHETKLMMEKRCRFCNYLTSPSYETEDHKQANIEMIKELDSWEPKSVRNEPKKKLSKTTRKSLSSNTGSQRKDSRSSSQDRKILEIPQKLEETVGEASTAEPIVEEEVKEVDSATILKSIKEASEKIQYVDAIEEKKKSGYYSKWRENKLKPCDCESPVCDCNTNPAVKAYLSPSTTKLEQSKSTDVGSRRASKTIEEDHDQVKTASPEATEENLLSKEPSRSFQMSETELKPENVPVKKDSAVEQLSQIYKAPLETKEEEVSPKEPAKAVHLPEAEAKSEKKLMQKDSPMVPLSQLYKASSSQPIQKGEPVEPTHSPLDETVGSKPSILMGQRSETSTRSKSGKRPSKKSLRSLSVMINCVCDNDDCDCRGVIRLPEKPPAFPSGTSLPLASTEARTTTIKSDSIEMLRKKLSTLMDPPSAEDTPEDLAKIPNLRRASNRSVDSLEIHKRRMSFKSSRSHSAEDEEEIHTRGRSVSISLK